MAAGKPVIASAIPGNTEVVTHAKTGWLFPAGDAVALANAIRLLLSDRDLTKRLAAAAQELVQMEYSSLVLNQQVIQVYTKLLDKSQEGKNHDVRTG
jgi:glycosyltransferase involved in cell wall biosynthesis